MFSMTRAATLAAAFVALAACAIGGTAPARSDPPSPVPEVQQRRWKEANYVIRTQEAWSSAWSAAPSLVVPESPPPPVDFAVHMLVGVAAGWGPNGCAGLSIRRVTEEAAAIRVEYAQADGRAPPGVACSAALVQLVGFARVARSAKPVTFVRAD